MARSESILTVCRLHGYSGLMYAILRAAACARLLWSSRTPHTGAVRSYALRMTETCPSRHSYKAFGPTRSPPGRKEISSHFPLYMLVSAPVIRIVTFSCFSTPMSSLSASPSSAYRAAPPVCCQCCSLPRRSPTLPLPPLARLSLALRTLPHCFSPGRSFPRRPTCRRAHPSRSLPRRSLRPSFLRR